MTNTPPTAADDAANDAAHPVIANPALGLVTLQGPVSLLANDSDADAGETPLLRVAQAGATEAAQSAVAESGTTEIDGTYGTLHIRADGTYSYQLDSTRAATMALAAGVQATETFWYTAANGSDPDDADAAALAIVAQGANDLPRNSRCRPQA